MENHDLHPMTILKLKKIHQCGKCYKTLRKILLEVNGVYAVSTDQEKKLVSVRGKVDPSLLIKAIEEIGNTAELLSYEKEPKKKSYSESKKSASESIQKNGREKKSHSFSKGKETKEKEEHKIEAYEPQKIDPEICRDPFCKLHKRRPIITNHVPSKDNENHPHHTGRGFFPGAHQLFHQRNPLQYYDYPLEMAAPPATGSFYSRRPRPHGCTFYGYGSPRECTTM